MQQSQDRQSDRQTEAGTSPVRNPMAFNRKLALTFVVLVVLLAVFWGFAPW